MSDTDPTILEVYDAVLGAFKSAWDANAAAAIGASSTPSVEWPLQPEAQTPLAKGEAPWARVSLRHATSDQTTVGGLPGQTNFQSSGVVRVNIFVLASKRGLVDAALLGKVALDAFRGVRSGPVWFTGVRPQEVGVDGLWYQFDVTATFRYANNR